MTVEPSIQETVLETIDNMKNQIIQAVSDLVKIQSVNPSYLGVKVEDVIGGEMRNNEVLRRKLNEMNFHTEMWEVIPKRANLAGTRKGIGGGKSLILFGHIDSVPPGNLDLWKRSPFSGDIAEGKIWGRGSTDQKGSLVAALFAIKAIDNAKLKLKGDLTFMSTIGEETGEGGAEGVIPGGVASAIDSGYRADAAICTEPAPGIWITQPHLLWLRVSVNGKSAHSMLRREIVHSGGRGSEVAVSAIDKGIKMYDALRELERQWGITKKHPLFPPGHFSIGPNIIRAGPSDILTPFIIPDTFTMDCCIWAHPEEDVNAVKEELEHYINAVASCDEWMKDHPPKLEWKLWWAPFKTPEDHPLVKTVSTAVKAVTGEAFTITGCLGVLDCAFVSSRGIPTVAVGVPNEGIVTAHAENEFIKIDDLIKMTKVFALSILDWCRYEKAESSTT